MLEQINKDEGLSTDNQDIMDLYLALAVGKSDLSVPFQPKILEHLKKMHERELK